MGREENIRIFENTLDLIRTDSDLIEAVKASNRNQKLILEGENYKGASRKEYDSDAEFVVSRMRSLEAAGKYKGYKTAVLNFASAVQPGGGVVNGSSAQEEAICRCSTLYPSLKEGYLWSKFYSPHRRKGDRRNNDDVIYTPSVVVFKSDDDYPSLLDKSKWYSVNIITAAAPDLREPRERDSDYSRGKVNIPREELRELHLSRMRRILEIASGEGNECLILGAYGCGAFRNPPDLVADVVAEVALEYRRKFRVIECAVYCPPYRDDLNYREFKRAFGRQFQYPSPSGFSL